jgi:hypothetical protein
MANEFELGQLVATPAAFRLLSESSVDSLGLIRRHLALDAGVLSSSDQEANRRAVGDGGRILSAFDVGGQRVWIITEAVGDDGRRQSMCILLPDEY